MATLPTPTITDSVRQSFFIEALRGPRQPASYLDRFPDTVYSKAIDSLLVRFMYALLGPVGVGQLKREFLDARLQIEEAGLSTVDLDSAYGSVFGLARLAEETYQLDANAALLPAAQRAQILAQDASFRNRAITFLKGARAGGTVLGVTLAATSGLNRPVEVFENYKALYDRYSDRPLGLPFLGSTRQTNEAIVVPRQITPRSSQQILTISGEPTQGWFTMTYPAGQEWSAIAVTTTAGSPTIAVPSAAQCPAGAFVTLTNLPTSATAAQIDPTSTGWNHATLFAQSAGGSGTSISLIYPESAGVSAGNPANAPSTGSFIALVGIARTTLLPYNASAADIENALSALPVIGRGNIAAEGGPLPNQPISIRFTGSLSDQPVRTLLVNLDPDPATGVKASSTGGTEQMADVTHSPLDVAANIDVGIVGTSTDGETTTISAADEHAMRVALDRIRPVTSLITSQDGESKARRQQVTRSFTASSRTEVIRYVTGRASVRWPTLDATHWIERGREHEAPRPLGGAPYYQGFHNVANIQSYTEAALADSGYLDGSTPVSTYYWDSLIGSFSAAQQTLVPALAELSSPTAQLLPSGALAPQAEPLVLSSAGSQAVINSIYPSDYYALPGVSQATGGSLWASAERSYGTDYLEIDLGDTQAVNYLYFEATRKPFIISVHYDLLDQAPTREFYPVSIAPSDQGGSSTSLAYDNTATTPWAPVEIYFQNARDGMVYTRFLRIGFSRAPDGSPFSVPTPSGPNGLNVIPYSIEVRNLRVGRNVNVVTGSIQRHTQSGGGGSSSQAATAGQLLPSISLFPGSDVFPG
jgi:hypothetical protein